MKYINWLIGSLLTLAFLSCMDDKGSYDYTKLDEPVEIERGFEYNMGRMSCLKWRSLRVLFYMAGDSAARAAGVRYEWKVNGVVLSEEADFEIETEKLMNLIKLSEYPKTGVNGTFGIIEKETGIAYMVRAFCADKSDQYAW